MIRAQNLWGDTAGILYNIIFGLGALCLYGTLYYARLIPRWISVWGGIAIVVLLGIVGVSIFMPLPAWTALLIVPIGVQEMVMALWMIFRGFDARRLRDADLDMAEVQP